MFDSSSVDSPLCLEIRSGFVANVYIGRSLAVELLGMAEVKELQLGNVSWKAKIMYLGDVKDALYISKNLDGKDNVSWNSMIAKYISPAQPYVAAFCPIGFMEMCGLALKVQIAWQTCAIGARVWF
ncbi:hypothetical protein ACE6H2_024120 [Prunus campanulata]